MCFLKIFQYAILWYEFYFHYVYIYTHIVFDVGSSTRVCPCMMHKIIVLHRSGLSPWANRRTATKVDHNLPLQHVSESIWCEYSLISLTPFLSPVNRGLLLLIMSPPLLDICETNFDLGFTIQTSLKCQTGQMDYMSFEFLKLLV